MSRRYPFISLPKAVDRARELFDEETMAATAIPVAAKHWGYGEKSSGAFLTVAALISYGLLEDEGSGKGRKIRASEKARRILRDKRPESPDRDRLIREAALAPKLFQELWGEWGKEWPSESSMEHYLTFTLDFKDKSAKECLKVFLGSVVYAGLRDSDIIQESPENGEQEDEPPETRLEQIRRSGRKVISTNMQESAARVLTIPLPGERIAVLETPTGLSTNDYDFLVKYLDLMKDALIGKVDTENGNSDNGQPK